MTRPNILMAEAYISMAWRRDSFVRPYSTLCYVLIIFMSLSEDYKVYLMKMINVINRNLSSRDKDVD